MKLLVLATALALVAAAPKPQGYDLPVPQGQRLSHGGCAEGEVANVDGSCAVPDVTRHVYVYTPPEEAVQRNPSPPLPNPKVEYNVLFIRSPDNNKGRDPIIVPPPRQQSVVYVLNKRPPGGQRVIEVPGHPAQSPQVYFVNYSPNENPTLPGGVDLNSALSSAVQSDSGFVGDAAGAAFAAGVRGDAGDAGFGAGADAGFGAGPAGHGAGPAFGITPTGPFLSAGPAGPAFGGDFGVGPAGPVGAGFRGVGAGAGAGFDAGAGFAAGPVFEAGPAFGGDVGIGSGPAGAGFRGDGAGPGFGAGPAGPGFG